MSSLEMMVTRARAISRWSPLQPWKAESRVRPCSGRGRHLQPLTPPLTGAWERESPEAWARGQAHVNKGLPASLHPTPGFCLRR